ncbi:hypothetical protein SAMN05421736_11986 [Evansella caseinilytica]|uniref:Uncharacterized protein n=1 Tax=Evansella caseinilytica TaxID=1503961 RepID=A0A1H3UB87_9BACI|nr:hypothetical protein [Evansella caseinilytica]SDZ59075.1 hypothetical protein SAMN05421736_11986 [Evansella caseinilytica]
MTNKTAIILTEPSGRDCLPAELSPYATAALGGMTEEADEMATLPLNWCVLQNVFKQYDRIVVTGGLSSADRMMQGNPLHFSEMLLIVLREAAKSFDKEVYLLRKKEPVLLNPLSDSELIAIAGQQATVFSTSRKRIKTKSVTSVQKNDTGHLSTYSADDWAECYFAWLNNATRGLVKVQKKGWTYYFCAAGLHKPLLVLEKNHAVQSTNVAELMIKSGFLNAESAAAKPIGRFWFISSCDGKFVYTSLVHFQPALPWLIYRLTQGWIHSVVMQQFQRYIQTPASST